jgi:peptide/nickel transport system substrate-binding protein
LGFTYEDMQDYNLIVDQFLAGNLNLLQYVTIHRRDDLRAAPGVQLFEYPSNTWVAISLNLANPFEPQSALDENGNRLEQGHHPIFGDVRVRRALQMALDVEKLIEISMQGNGTIMPANQIPTSWAYNDNLSAIGYDPVTAERLLEEVGWKDVNRDGIRECIGCLFAREGTPLSFQLGSDTGDVLTFNIQQQLRKVGVDVSVSSGSYGSALSQTYDAFLTLYTESYPVDADQSDLFTVKGDVVGEGLNYGSYYNVRVETLMQQARTVPDCDYETRAQLYREAQTILQEDQPYLWLFALNDMIAVRGVQGFVPYPNAPFWNIGEWVIH